MRFTQDVEVRHGPENGECRGRQEIMTTTVPIPEVAQLLCDPEGSALRRGEAEPMEAPDPADAEEEEIAQLWAADPGNQGA